MNAKMFFGVFAGVMLAACTTVARNLENSGKAITLPENMAVPPDGKTGVVFGSIGRFQSRIDTPTLSYRAIGGSSGSARIRYDWQSSGVIFLKPDDIMAEGTRGTVFSARLPAGTYEIFSASGHETIPESYGTPEELHVWSSPKGWMVRFEVKDGVATYLGEFIAHRNPPRVEKGGSRRALGFLKEPDKVVLTGFHFKVANRLARDRQILAAKPELPQPGERVENAVASLLATGAPVLMEAPSPK